MTMSKCDNCQQQFSCTAENERCDKHEPVEDDEAPLEFGGQDEEVQSLLF